jgi:hypothetical protein
MQQQWSAQGVAGGPDEPESTRIERIEKLREIGAIDESEYEHLITAAKGGDAGPTPGGAEATPVPEGAPSIVAHRLYPGLRARSSTRQLDHFIPRYREQLGLCPEDVYGVYPRSTRTSSTDAGSFTEWNDFWIVYRDRPEYEPGRATWAADMNKKGNWPEPEDSLGFCPNFGNSSIYFAWRKA